MAAYSLQFFNVDNQAQVIINNAVAWDSQIIHFDPPLEQIPVDLDDFLQPGSNLVTVRVFNAPGFGENPWHIKYNIILKGKVILSVEHRGPDQDFYSGPPRIAKEIPHTFKIPASADYADDICAEYEAWNRSQ